MKKHVIIFLLLAIFILISIGACRNPFFPGPKNNSGQKNGGAGIVDNDGTGNADSSRSFGTVAWVSTLFGAEGGDPELVVAQFTGVAVDQNGDVYALGFQNLNYTYSYGSDPAAVVAGAAAGGPNNVLVKYGPDGNAQWAKAIMQSGSWVSFTAIAVDQNGNIYIAGYQGIGSIGYGNGISSTGPNNDYNPALVKYDSSGKALWAYTLTASPGTSSHAEFKALAAGQDGNLYAAGFQIGNGTYTYETGVTAAGTSTGRNPVLVKIGANDGKAQWVCTITGGSDNAEFGTIAADGTGNVYVAGYQNGLAAYTYGTNATAAGVTSGNNAVLVKYDANGDAKWARAPSDANGASIFNSAAVDGAGNIYAAGSGTNGIPVLVKYDTSGNALWAKTPVGFEPSGTCGVTFNSIAVDNAGFVYAAGSQSGACDYGNGVTVTNSNGIKTSSLLVKYDASGTAQGAWIVKESTEESGFWGIALDPSSAYFYAVGYQCKDGEFDYGDDIVVNGIGDESSTLVKYTK